VRDGKLTLGRLGGFDTIGNLFLWTSIVSSSIFLISLRWQPYPGSVLIKAMSILTLALLTYHMRAGRPGLTLVLALLFSSIGDAILGFDPEKLFVFGLGSFLIAHLIYIILFTRYWLHPLTIGRRRRILILTVAVYSVSMAWWLLPNLRGLAVPVIAYLCVITIMFSSAILADFASPWVVIGAALFIFSDSLLAVNKFKLPIPMCDYSVWISYYLAQCFITIALLHGKSNSPSKS